MLRMVADENLAAAAEAFAGWGEVVRLPGRAIGPADVATADALFVRSVTRVDEVLVAGSRLRFVGSATIGVDHIDQAALQRHGITFAHAPGCNAAAVADWVVAALAVCARQRGHRLGQGRVGVIGAGHVGTRVAARLAALGYHVRCCDPPRADVEGRAGFVDLATALASDVVSLHVPLTRDGPHATCGLIDDRNLAMIPPGAILLNAARGGVIAEDALAARLAAQADLTAALDTWEGEPAIASDLLKRVALGTPHIAGYSLEGRLRGTAAIAAAAAGHFARPLTWDWRTALPPAPGAMHGGGLAEAILGAYDPCRDDAALRALANLPEAARGRAFDALRCDYPMRREFAAWQRPAGRPDLAAVGFGAGLDGPIGAAAIA